MNIAINGERLSAGEPAGPELYTLNIIKALAKIDTKNTYFILLSNFCPDSLKQLPRNFNIVTLDKFLSWTQVSLAKYLFIKRSDILFTAVHTLPLLKPRSLKILSMIHGLEYGNNKRGNGLPAMLTCMFSDQIVAPSEATKSLISSTGWKLKNPNIAVIPEGVNENFKMQESNKISAVRAKFNLENINYAIFISTIQPRKNLPKLINAFSILNSKYNADLHLVVIGKRGWGYDESLQAPVKFHVEDKIHFLGRLDEDDVISLLSGAKLYVSSSFDEGFGLPLLEAMSVGVPCVVSDIKAYKELAKDTALYFDPNNPNDIAEKILKILKTDVQVINDMISKAEYKAQEFTWEKSAQKLLEVFGQYKK